MDAGEIGKWLREAREGQGRYSQEKAAHEIGVTGKTVGSWENGRVAPPVDKLLALAVLYGADAREILTVPRPAAADSASGEPLAGQAVAPSGAPGVNQAKSKADLIPEVPPSAFAPARPETAKARPKKRPA